MLAATQILTGFDRTLRLSGGGDETAARLLLDLFQVVGGPLFQTLLLYLRGQSSIDQTVPMNLWYFCCVSVSHLSDVAV